MSAAAQLRALLCRFWSSPLEPLPTGPLRCEAQAEAGGVAPLLYWRLQEAAPAHWKNLYRLETLRMGLQEAELCRIAQLLHKHQIRALLGKGWSVARHYPAPGLRPCGDIDLYVDPSQINTARRVLTSQAVGIDLHRGCADLAAHRFEALWQRAHKVQLQGETVSMFCDRDLLELVIVHAARHGMAKPLWLCDVAVLSSRLGSETQDFVRERGCMLRTIAPSALGTETWLESILALSYKWLGAGGRGRVPPWVEACVSRAWETPFHVRLPLLSQSSFSAFWRELPRHWPSEIEASVFLQEAWGESPKPYWQLVSFLQRAGQALRNKSWA